jgi:hypothetical protein
MVSVRVAVTSQDSVVSIVDLPPAGRRLAAASQQQASGGAARCVRGRPDKVWQGFRGKVSWGKMFCGKKSLLSARPFCFAVVRLHKLLNL